MYFIATKSTPRQYYYTGGQIGWEHLRLLTVATPMAPASMWHKRDGAEAHLGTLVDHERFEVVRLKDYEIEKVGSIVTVLTVIGPDGELEVRVFAGEMTLEAAQKHYCYEWAENNYTNKNGDDTTYEAVRAIFNNDYTSSIHTVEIIKSIFLSLTP